MKFRLTKTSKIVSFISIGLLSLLLGFLVWRVNNRKPDQTLAPVDSSAAEGFCLDVDPNYIFPLTEMQVCGYGCFKYPAQCPPERSFTINVPVAGTYTVTGVVARGHEYGPDAPVCTNLCQCQNYESFHLDINGTTGNIAKDDITNQKDNSCYSCTGTDGCPVTVISQDLGVFTFKEGSNSIKMSSDAPGCCDDGGVPPCGSPYKYSPNSVQVVQVCLYPMCGDGELAEDEDCDPTSDAENFGCPAGYQCLDDCTCSAVAKNICDGIGSEWISKPTGDINFDSNISFSATAGDSTGVSLSSIEAFLCEGTQLTCSSTSGQSISVVSAGSDGDSTIDFSGVLSSSTRRLSPGEYTLTAIWEDILQGTGADCTLTTTFTILEEETNPNWDISKSVVEQCIDDNTESPISRLTYTITVENTGDGSGTISKVEDVLDNKVLGAGLVPNNITSPGEYSTGKIVWDYTSSPLSITAGSSKTFSYTLDVDKDNFGIYNNTATLTPVGSADIQASATIEADCNIVQPEEPEPEGPIPQTGIFDRTIGRIFTGIVLLLFGVAVYNIPNRAFLIQNRKPNYKYRDRFEKKVDKK